MALTTAQRRRQQENQRYWDKREREALQYQDLMRRANTYERHIDNVYERMIDSVQKEIDAFYSKYATAEGISLAEAKRRAATLDIDAYSRKAKQYVETKDFSDQANAEMRLYNMTMKVNRLELLKANMGLELVSGFDELQKYFDGTLTEETLREFRRQAGILGETIGEEEKRAAEIVDGSWHNATFSERIWSYQDVLRFELGKHLSTGLIAGKNPRELARDIRKTFDVSRYNAERLMRTELARVQIETQKQSFEANDVEQYEFIANGRTACPICREMDGQHFSVKDMVIGKNAPPMHPNCMCSTAAWVDEDEYAEWIGSKGMDAVAREREVSRGRDKTIEELKNTSKSAILKLQDYQEIVDYFRRNYDIAIEGFERRAIDDVKMLLAGYDDLIQLAPPAGEFIKIIRFDPSVRDYARMSEEGISRVGVKGVGSYSTGVHEATHAVDFSESVPGTHSYAEDVLKTARRELGLTKTSREYKKLAFDTTYDGEDMYIEYEVLAYSIETELCDGNSNNLTKAVWKAFRERFEK